MSKAIAILDDLYRAPGLDRVDRLSRGLPAGIFPMLAHVLAISTKALAQALGISERTLRNRTRRLTSDEAERSFRAYRVFRRATEALESEEQARLWLNTPQRALGERRPIDLLKHDIGAEEVLNVLAAIEDGGYL